MVLDKIFSCCVLAGADRPTDADQHDIVLGLGDRLVLV